MPHLFEVLPVRGPIPRHRVRVWDCHRQAIVERIKGNWAESEEGRAAVYVALPTNLPLTLTLSNLILLVGQLARKHVLANRHLSSSTSEPAYFTLSSVSIEVPVQSPDTMPVPSRAWRHKMHSDRFSGGITDRALRRC